ncbi:MarR family winged helix-turn-helix transcriptional regulator [Martelella radicis]|uniref:DNA-binding MarR family transcriptional regulator n=1 Tax=Martelella radicis TaxID=1397476 RepID=A0A7W6PAJ6_9HYPH|nr:MarR family transcriptional regulator [Martelella radicis]MBB4121497.1 DNA-binding MarR family transcriptional regulator [Martelella radicis]
MRSDNLADPVRDDGQAEFEIVELLFFAYRDFISDPDAILQDIGFGRAHHRVVHFVGSRPGMSVADLLDTLGITKQSLARVLKQLIDAGYVRQTTGPEDRRQRRLFLSQKGEDLRQQLLAPQLERIAKAFSGLGESERAAVKDFLSRMCNDDPTAFCGALLSANDGKEP